MPSRPGEKRRQAARGIAPLGWRGTVMTLSNVSSPPPASNGPVIRDMFSRTHFTKHRKLNFAALLEVRTSCTIAAGVQDETRLRFTSREAGRRLSNRRHPGRSEAESRDRMKVPLGTFLRSRIGRAGRPG